MSKEETIQELNRLAKKLTPQELFDCVVECWAKESADLRAENEQLIQDKIKMNENHGKQIAEIKFQYCGDLTKAVRHAIDQCRLDPDQAVLEIGKLESLLSPKGDGPDILPSNTTISKL